MIPLCPNCHDPVDFLDAFCGSCGHPIVAKRDAKEKRSLRLVIAFYIAFLLYSIVSYALYLENNNLLTELIMESVFILITVVFALYDTKRICALYNFARVNAKNLLFAFLFPVFSALLVYYGSEMLNLYIFEDSYNTFDEYAHFPNMLFWVLLFYTIIPPVFEELAFRGFLFNQLLEISTWKVTILATAFMFALVHFSLIAFLWIFPFGIVLGYLRHKYNTLWLGMIIHFIHNFLVVMIDYYHFINDDVFSI